MNNEKQLYKVVKVWFSSTKKKVLYEDLTETEAQRIVQSFPNDSRTMVIYQAQQPK